MKWLKRSLPDILGIELSQGRKQSSRSAIRDVLTPLDMTRRPFNALHVYQDFPSRSAAMNMAIDEALLEKATVPSIRLYRWNSPALSFGYFGRFSDVASYATQRDLVRRWTGGGIVLHGDDLTYSVIIPRNDPVFAGSSMSIYENVHRALRNALAANGGRVELAAMGRNAALRRSEPQWHLRTAQRAVPTNVCFANPVSADVMVNGRKVAGAAQRRTRSGLLHQGSIQNVDLANGLGERFAQALSTKCTERKIDNDALKRACELAEQKYGTDGWLRKR